VLGDRSSEPVEPAVHPWRGRIDGVADADVERILQTGRQVGPRWGHEHGDRGHPPEERADPLEINGSGGRLHHERRRHLEHRQPLAGRLVSRQILHVGETQDRHRRGHYVAAMAAVSELVLHSLVIKGFCSEAAAADATGLPVETVTETLDHLGDRGLARYRDGRISGWAPTPEGRAEHRELLGGPLAASDPAAALVVYERFAPLNAEFKLVCTDWQLGGQDRGAIDRLVDIHRRASQLLTELCPALPRVAHYQARLEDALTALQAGDGDRFTRPLCNSYHDVWMELHQDMLLTLGLSRTSADA
jgi:hypothetical protein